MQPLLSILASPVGFLVSIGVVVTGCIYIFSAINKQTLETYKNLVGAKNEIISDLQFQVQESNKKLDQLEATIKEQQRIITDMKKQMEGMKTYSELSKMLLESISHFDTRFDEIKALIAPAKSSKA